MSGTEGGTESGTTGKASERGVSKEVTAAQRLR